LQYKGEPSPLNWPDINSHFGVVDIAGFPKDAYYYYYSWWVGDNSSVHIVPSNWNNPVPPGTNIGMIVYANAAYVSLTVNGKNLGNKWGWCTLLRLLGYIVLCDAETCRIWSSPISGKSSTSRDRSLLRHTAHLAPCWARRQLPPRAHLPLFDLHRY
jgi:hypothetical protein